MNDDKNETQSDFICLVVDGETIGKFLGAIIRMWPEPGSPKYLTFGLPDELSYVADTFEELKEKILAKKSVRFQEPALDSAT